MVTPDPSTFGKRSDKIAWITSFPFAVMHVVPFLAIWVDVRPTDWLICLALYYVRMFGITAGYHRYFAHRAYRMGRVTQFVMAWIGSMSAQKGVLWWAAHHRIHHKYSDLPGDIHSPKEGVFWSHMGWMITATYDETDWDRIKDFQKYPELVWLNKYWLVAPVSLAVACFLLGGWGTVIIGFVLSTVLLYHGTFLVNSAAHLWGGRRFVTTDTSRNNFLIALLTCGEGWHNNHHHYQSSANQGFYWWEVDPSYYIIKMMQLLGLAWDVRKPPEAALERDRLDRPGAPIDIGMMPSPADAE
jgi:stearoyl-CoA desaturase (delta-9 desaturase)